MALLSTDSRSFFGLDTGAWRTSAQRLLALPALRWVQPAVRVQLRQADGQTSHWNLAHGVATPAPAGGEAPVAALQLPADRAPRSSRWWAGYLQTRH